MSDFCSLSTRVDGPNHSWRFDGDDLYVECAFCGQYQDALTGGVIREGRSADNNSDSRSL